MCASTTPAAPRSGPKSRPESLTPSVDSNVISLESAVAPCGASSAHAERSSSPTRMVRTWIGVRTPMFPPLLAQLQALVPGALEKLLVLLLAHLLPALLHEGRQRSMPFIRSFGSEEVPEVDPLRSEAFLQTNGTQSKRFGRLCHR